MTVRTSLTANNPASTNPDSHVKSRWKREGIGLALVLWIGILCCVPIMSNDIWWHLAYGRALAEHGILATHDIFSWTHQGVATLHIPWLPGLFLYVVL